MDLLIYLAIFSVAFATCLGIIPAIIRWAAKNGLAEENNERKIHLEKVSNLGGIGIVIGTICAILLVLQPAFSSPIMAFALGLPLMLLGIADDQFHVGVTTRLVIQAVLTALLYEMGFQIELVEGWWLFNLGTTIFFVLLLINAYNFIDGINGLAGGLGAISSVAFGVLLAMKGNLEMSLACFAFTGGLLAFLCFNFGKKAKIFMGDNGSTVLGFYLAVMILTLLQPTANGEAQYHWSLIFAPVLLPVADLFKVALFRVGRMQSPFWGDRTHIHHLFTDGGLSHPAACLVLYGWTVFGLCLALWVPEQSFWKILSVTWLVPYALASAVQPIKRYFNSGSAPAPVTGKRSLPTLQTN